MGGCYNSCLFFCFSFDFPNVVVISNVFKASGFLFLNRKVYLWFMVNPFC